MNTPKWFVIASLVLALCLPATPAYAARSASMSLTPPQPNPGLIDGDVNFALVVNVTDVVPGAAAVEVYLAYDPNRVTPPASPTGIVEALPDFFGFSNVTIGEKLLASQCPGGTQPCIRLLAAGPAQTTKSGAVARFHFRCAAEGTATFTVLTSTLKDADGYTIEHTSAAPVSVPCVFQARVNGKILRQGTPGNPNPGGGTIACSTAKITTQNAATIGPVLTSQSGEFSLTNIPLGSNTLRAEYPGYLSSEKGIPVSTGGQTTIDVGPTTLRGGDANADNAINILDIGSIISKFGSTGAPVRSDLSDCNDPDEASDINDDGNINISDLAIAAGNWGRTGPTPWQP